MSQSIISSLGEREEAYKHNILLSAESLDLKADTLPRFLKSFLCNGN